MMALNGCWALTLFGGLFDAVSTQQPFKQPLAR